MKHEPGDASPPVATFDWTTESPSRAVVTAVAAVSDTAPGELPPLYRSVEADSLDALLARMRSQDTPGWVAFEYCDRRMVLAADGEGRVYGGNQSAGD